MNNLELKVAALREALRERVSDLIDQYENRIADLRIEITLLNEDNNSLRQQVAGLSATQEYREKKVLEGEIVQEEEPTDNN